jgi:hypothetical protein
MNYSLVAVSMTESELTTIQKRATTNFTRKCGFEGTFPKVLVHGPIAFGGLGFHHLYVESNILKIETLLCNINKSTILGKKFQMNLQWAQIHTGKSTQLLATNKHLDYMQSNWFLEIKLFLNKINAKIKIQNAWTPTKHRVNDIIIMDADELYNHDTKAQKIINNWRMYYNVNNLSDITNYAGDTILPKYINKKYIRLF